MNNHKNVYSDIHPRAEEVAPTARRRRLSREGRILALAVIFFLSGCAFFLLHTFRKDEAPVQPVAVAVSENRSDTRSALAHYPAPESFEHFTFTPGMRAYAVSGTCSDRYYAILIYQADVDYRESALDAKYNMASECVDGIFETAIGLHSLPLTEETSYYVVRAQQGEEGGWYNPY